MLHVELFIYLYIYLFIFLWKIFMYQLAKLTGAISLLQLVISSSLIRVTYIKAPSELELGSPAWEADDKPTELSLMLNSPGIKKYKFEI